MMFIYSVGSIELEVSSAVSRNMFFLEFQRLLIGLRTVVVLKNRFGTFHDRMLYEISEMGLVCLFQM